MADKKLLMAIMAKRKPEEEAPAEEGMGDGLETAAQELIDAVNAGDAAAVAAALRSAVEMCQYGPEE